MIPFILTLFQNTIRQIGAAFWEYVFELFLMFWVFWFDHLRAATVVAREVS